MLWLFKTLKRRWYIVVLIILVVGGFTYAYINQSSKQTEKSTHTVTKSSLQEVLVLSGEINAGERVLLHFQTPGRLAWVGVQEGDRVEKYQGIASLDQRQLQKTLEKYLNTYEKTRYTFEQTDDDYADDEVSLTKEVRTAAERVLKQSQLTLDSSVLDVELQSIAKEYAYLYTPIDGIVTRADAEVAGVNVSVTDMYEVVNPDTVHFSLSADQTEVIELKEGMKGTIVLDAFPDQEFSGVIQHIAFSPKTNESGTVYEVQMGISGVDFTSLRLGMTGDVTFVVKTSPEIVHIPYEFLIEEDNGTYVMKKMPNGSFEKTAVEVGNEYDFSVEIVQGLSEGDVVGESEN